MKTFKVGILFLFCIAVLFLCPSRGNNQEVSIDTLLTLDSSGAAAAL